MNVRELYGAHCKLGYGYNSDLGYILPFDCEPINVKKGNCKMWSTDENLMDPYTPILNQNYLKILENKFIIDGKKSDYRNFFIRKENEYDECDGCYEYPDNISDYITSRTFGLLLNVTYKKSHGCDIKEILMGILEGKSDLSKTLEDLECYVLINGKERHEWTLKELVEFCRDHGDDAVYQCTLDITTQNTDSSPWINYGELDALITFLEYLYLCYRKIEIINREEFYIHEAHHDSIFIKSEKELTKDVNDAVDEYKRWNKDDLIEYGISMKKFFKSYKSYLEYCVLHGNNIDNVDAVVGDVDEEVDKLKKLLDDLNSSSITVFTSKLMKKYKLDLAELNKSALNILDGLKDGDFRDFIVLLYLCYKKIKSKLVNAGHVKHYFDATIQYHCVKTVILELQETMEEYRNKSSKSILERYPTMEKLFWCYLKYINLCKKHDSTIDEEIPGTVDELNSLYEKLDSWQVKRAGDKCYGSDEKVVFSKESYLSLPPELKQLHESGKIRVIINEKMESNESFLVKYPDVEGVCGLIKTKSSSSLDSTDTDIIYESKCSHKKCSDISRKWICTDCSGLLKMRGLYCGCKEYKMDQLDYICPSKKPQEEEDENSSTDNLKIDEKEKIELLSNKLKITESTLAMYDEIMNNFFKKTDMYKVEEQKSDKNSSSSESSMNGNDASEDVTDPVNDREKRYGRKRKSSLERDDEDFDDSIL